MNCSRQIQTAPVARWILVVLIIAMVSGGCEPLRKKFVRKKKKKDAQSSEFIPVLEPIDYPDRIASAASRYKQHYQLWKVYQKDFLTVLNESGADKRLKYMMSQMIMHLGEMQKYLDASKQEKLQEHIDSFGKVLSYIEDTPDIVRDDYTIGSRVNRIGKKLRREFTFEKVKDSINP